MQHTNYRGIVQAKGIDIQQGVLNGETRAIRTVLGRIQGLTINQVHNIFETPKSIAHQWYKRGYHGSPAEEWNPFGAGVEPIRGQ